MKTKLITTIILVSIYLAPVAAHGFILVGLFDGIDTVVTWSKILKSTDKVTGQTRYHTKKLGGGNKFYDWPVYPFTRNFWRLADRLELKRKFIFAFPLVVFFDKTESGFEASDSDGGAILTDIPILQDHPPVLKALSALVVTRIKDLPSDGEPQPIVLTVEEVTPIVASMVTVEPAERQALIEKLTRKPEDATAK